MAPNEGVQYVGFWARVLAALIDSVLILLVVAPLLYWFYGPAYFAPMLDSLYGPASSAGAGLSGPVEFLLNWVFPAIAVIVFWIYRQATPGKMIIGARIVDANTGGPPSTGQLIGRYFGYYVSMIPLFLGMIWVAFDARKQGWHDKLAGTVVIRERR
jgi:uncharacterized RDD family membrane protein YckC